MPITPYIDMKQLNFRSHYLRFTKEFRLSRKGESIALMLLGTLCLFAGDLMGESVSVPGGDRVQMMIPKVAGAPTIDGRLDEGEWDDAAAITGVVSQIDGLMNPRQAVFFISYDDEFLYLAQRSKVFPEERELKGPKTWGPKWDTDASDSSFFVGVVPGRKGSGDTPGIYLLRTLLDKVDNHKTGEPEWFVIDWEAVREFRTVKLTNLFLRWESLAVMEAQIDENGIWTAEMKVPLVSMNVEQVADGEKWAILFARDYSQADQNAIGQSTDWRFGFGWRHAGLAFYNNYLKEDEYMEATLESGIVAVQALELWHSGGDVPAGETRSRFHFKNTGSATQAVEVHLSSTETDTFTLELDPGESELLEVFQQAPSLGQVVTAAVSVIDGSYVKLLEQSLPLKGGFYADRTSPVPTFNFYPSHKGGNQKDNVFFASGYDPINNRFYGRMDFQYLDEINLIEDVEVTIRKGGSDEPLLTLEPATSIIPEAIIDINAMTRYGVVLEWLAPDDGRVDIDMEAAYWYEHEISNPDGSGMQVIHVQGDQSSVVIPRTQFAERKVWGPLVKHGIDVKEGDRIQFYYDPWTHTGYDAFVMRGTLTQAVYGVTKAYTPGGDFSASEQGGTNGAWFYRYDTDTTPNVDGEYAAMPNRNWKGHPSPGIGWGRPGDAGKNRGFISKRIFAPEGELIVDEEIPVLEPGVYQATATARDAKGDILAQSRYNFIRYDHEQDMPWIDHQLGVSNEVQPPWVPIENQKLSDGRESFSVWGRDYEVDGSGLLTGLKVSTESGLDREKRDILAAPIEFELMQNGAKVRLDPVGDLKNVAVAAHEASWRGAVAGGGWFIETDVTQEYDGYAAHTVRIVPPEGAITEAKLEKLSLVIPLKEKYAFNLHSIGGGQGNWFRTAVNSIPLDTSTPGQLWHSGQMSGGGVEPRHDDYGRAFEAGNFRPYVWLGGANRGIAFMADSDEGWVPADKDKKSEFNKYDYPSMEVVRRDDGSVALVLNLVARPFAFDHERTIRFSLQATPIKSVPDDWRDLQLDMSTAFPGYLNEKSFSGRGGKRFAGWGWMGNRLKVDGVKWIGGHGSTPYPLNWDQAGIYREWMDEKMNIKVTPYQGLHSVLSFAEVDDPRMPAGKQASDTYGYLYPHISHNHMDGGGASGAQADIEYRLWNYASRITETGIEGMYFDLTEPVPTANPNSGFGYYIDLHDRPEIDGKVQPGFGLTRLREFFKRLRQLFLDGPAGEEGRTYIWMHSTDGNTVSAYAFCDIFLEGENMPKINRKVPNISQKIPAGRMQVMNNGAGKWGFQMTQLHMVDHVAIKEYQDKDKILNNVSGWYLLHDVTMGGFTQHRGFNLERKATFLPYWDPEVAAVLIPKAENAYASAYLQDNALAIVVFNDSDEARMIPVLVSPAELGLSATDDQAYSATYVIPAEEKAKERKSIERRLAHKRGDVYEVALQEFEDKWSQVPMKPEIRMVETNKIAMMVGIEPRGFRIVRLEPIVF